MTKRVLRTCGRSYTQEDLNYIGQEICKSSGVQFKCIGVDAWNRMLLLIAVKDGQDVKKLIPLSELRKYHLVSRVNEQPYFDKNGLCFYRDELEEAAQYYAQAAYSKYVKFNISHKNYSLVVYGRVRIMPTKFEVSLYEIDRYLKGVNGFNRR